MSVIRKTPYIETVIGSLTAEQIATFKSVINGSSPANVFRTLIGDAKLTNDDKGVKAINLELALGNIKSGILVYTNTYCVLFAYNSYQEIQIFKLNIADKTYEKVDEYCTIEEMRRVLVEGSEGGGDEWVEAMKEVLVRDTEQNEVQCGIHFYCDGDLETGTDVVCGRDLIVDGLNNIQDPDGNPLIPKPEDSDLGKFLKLGTTGIMWSNLPNVPSFQIITKATFESEEHVPLTNVVYIVYDTDGTCYVRYYTA